MNQTYNPNSLRFKVKTLKSSVYHPCAGTMLNFLYHSDFSICAAEANICAA